MMMTKIDGLTIVSVHNESLDGTRNTAIIHRDYDDTYIVVRNVTTERGEIEWSHAVQYDIGSLTEATQLFIQKIS